MEVSTESLPFRKERRLEFRPPPHQSLVRRLVSHDRLQMNRETDLNRPGLTANNKSFNIYLNSNLTHTQVKPVGSRIKSRCVLVTRSRVEISFLNTLCVCVYIQCYLLQRTGVCVCAHLST